MFFVKKIFFLVKRLISILYFLLILICCFGCGDSVDVVLKKNYDVTSNFYDYLISGDSPKISLLNLFLTNMPKGGDLHHHYPGSIYAETYLEWVKKKGWKIDICSLKIITNNQTDGCKLITVDELQKNDILFRKLLILWSNKDYDNHFHQQSPPDHSFFSTFQYFSKISKEYRGIGLDIIKNRAISENVQYIETMLSTVGASSEYFEKRDSIIKTLRNLKNQSDLDIVFGKIDSFYLSDDNFNKTIDNFIDKLETIHEGIDDANFTMRYQVYGVRVFDPLEVYTDLLSGFITADSSELIVGVNILAPENHSTSLFDYSLHMKMFNYLHRKFPNVNIALHAGELTLGMVRPEDLLFHIDEALNIAHAQRIGHAIDISYEKRSLNLLNEIKLKSAVEINLTSNEFILGVKENQHPYLIFSKYDVPMVISTDDSGVSRNNLTNEYLLLSSRYKPSYGDIKKYVYNSINYSFLNSDSKSKIKIELYRKFAEFEKNISIFANNINY